MWLMLALNYSEPSGKFNCEQQNTNHNTMKNNMFKTVLWISLAAMVAACNPAGETGDSASQSLDELRVQLSEKQAQFKQLEAEIEALSGRITEMDTTDKPRRLVTLDTVSLEDYRHFVDFQATVQSDEVARISADIGGRITRLMIREGQMVQKGQLVAKLDVETLQRQMEELETNLALATTVYERQQKLWEQKIGSEIQWIEAKSNKERLEKAKSTLQANLAKASVYAPCNGVVEIVNVKEGEFLAPGVPMAMIVNIKKIKVVANLPESYIGKVRRGDKVTIVFPTLDKEVNATISLIGKTISEGNRTFVVEAPVQQMPDDLLKPNLLARMKINDFTQKDAVIVKAELLQQESNGKQFVFVKSGSDTNAVAMKQFVEVDQIFEDKILIRSGLKKGDVIIAEGARGLSDNELISF
jgi:membrane fusion protein, multidrug efflux system